MTLGMDDRRTIGRHRLIATLGRGGMGDVYLTVSQGQLAVPKLLVAKVLRADLAIDDKFRKMFIDEARLATQLNHPNIVQTLEVGEDAGLHYMTLEYLEGQPLHVILSRIGRDKFPLDVHVRILSQVLGGLHAAHELRDFAGKALDVVHRDVSPQNVIVTYDGQVKVVDFGIAKVAGASVLTETGVMKGKIAYMAPEQAMSLPVDRRADIFAVGVMLWEALARDRFVPRGEPDVATLQKRVTGEVRSLREAAPDAPAELAEICEKALSADRERRFATAAEFQDALEAFTHKTDPRGGSREIGALVSNAFATERAALRARIEAQLQALSGAADLSLVDIPVTEADVSGKQRALTTPAPGSAVTKIEAPPRSNRQLWIGGVALLALSAASLGLFSRFRQQPGEVPASATPLPASAPSTAASAAISVSPSAPAASAPRTVEIHVAVKPPNARVALDDAPPAPAPFRGTLPSDGKTHRLVVSAAGFVDEKREIGSDRDLDLEVALSPAPTSVKPKPTGDGKHARPVDDTDPYAK